ncbi:hypothetical protein N7453_007520 [Penicillium expansum]|nr:hypothetical protein N7453_007520 [Penicillium expansum]
MPTKLPKRPTLRWDQHKRQVLCCLYRFFVCNKKETEEIFSYIFRGHLNQRGIQGFVPFATLNTQWVWMKNRRDPVWSQVHINTAFETDGEWKEVITKIRSAAKVLRFELGEKMEDNINTSHLSPLVSDDERSITFNEPAAAMLPDSLSTPETINPMVLLFSKRDHVLNRISRDNQSLNQDIDQSIDQQNDDTDLHNDLHDDIPNRLPGSTEPVVTSNGKLCLWCEHEGITYDSEDIQKPQDEDYNYDSEYEDHSHGNQNNDRQDNPIMREYTQRFKQFMRELDGEFLHLDEELFDSESESPITSQGSPSKLSPFRIPRIPSPSDLEQDILDTGNNSDWCADGGSPANLADLGTSISMEDRSGALDDDRIYTKKSLSNFRFHQSRTAHDEAPDGSFGGQRVFEYGWPSDDEMRVETLRQMSAEALRQVENQSITQFSNQEDLDVLMYDGNTWNQV